MSLMDYAHVFRRDGETHVVLTNKPNIKRNGRFLTVCAKRVDESFQRLSPHSEPGRSSPLTCDPCLSFMTTLMDFMEADDLKKVETLT